MKWKLQLVGALLAFSTIAPIARGQEVIVLSGLDETIAWFESEDFWGPSKHADQLTVPHAILTGINPAWRQNAQELPVAQKKEIFYRAMVPLVLHANQMVMDRRETLVRIEQAVEKGETISDADMSGFRAALPLLRIVDEEAAAELAPDSEELPKLIEEALYRLDIVPAGLALGQAAYESGYGTSRFAAEGNALFGQWTYGGKGLVPEQQRKTLGDHRIASFDWPFDSVRGYFINLMSHPAYEDFRALRAKLRSEGKPLTSMALADGLIRYSERGQEYVDTLKGIIRVNGLDVADDAVLREEPIRFLVGAATPETAAELREEIEEMRGSGELDRIIARMRLE